MKHVGSYEAKTHLPQLLDSVEAGEAFIITRNGRPAARLLPLHAGAVDPRAAIQELQAFSKKHSGKLRGIRIRDLIEDGQRF